MNIFKNKNILVTGGTGMIGIYLIEKLIKSPKLLKKIQRIIFYSTTTIKKTT
jgi:FlaA1/EpsC-like NDP-sugar epimerase